MPRDTLAEFDDFARRPAITAESTAVSNPSKDKKHRCSYSSNLEDHFPLLPRFIDRPPVQPSVYPVVSSSPWLTNQKIAVLGQAVFHHSLKVLSNYPEVRRQLWEKRVVESAGSYSSGLHYHFNADPELFARA